MSVEVIKDAAEAIAALREWVQAVPDDVQLPTMPGVSGDWLDQVESKLKKTMADQQQEPVAIYHGRCTIDCGENGHQDIELLKMIPAGSKLYTAPQPQRQPLTDEWAAEQLGFIPGVHFGPGAPLLISEFSELNKERIRLVLIGARAALGITGEAK